MKKRRHKTDKLPLPVYIMIRSAFQLSCLILLFAFALMCIHEEGSPGISHYMTAMALVEAPPGIMLVSLVLCAFLLDRS